MKHHLLVLSLAVTFLAGCDYSASVCNDKAFSPQQLPNLAGTYRLEQTDKLGRLGLSEETATIRALSGAKYNVVLQGTEPKEKPASYDFTVCKGPNQSTYLEAIVKSDKGSVSYKLYQVVQTQNTERLSLVPLKPNDDRLRRAGREDKNNRMLVNNKKISAVQFVQRYMDATTVSDSDKDGPQVWLKSN